MENLTITAARYVIQIAIVMPRMLKTSCDNQIKRVSSIESSDSVFINTSRTLLPWFGPTTPDASS
jgi:hypothetical protein